MAKTNRNASAQSKSRQTSAAKARTRAGAAKAATPTRTAQAHASAHTALEPERSGWATELVFDVREPKLAVSLRLDADVLRFFRGFGAGYQTRINEVLKAFMQARGGAETVSHNIVSARASRSAVSNGKRATR